MTYGPCDDVIAALEAEQRRARVLEHQLNFMIEAYNEDTGQRVTRESLTRQLCGKCRSLGAIGPCDEHFTGNV